MDLSKLPKFSNTPVPPPPAPDPAPQTAGPQVELFCQCGAPIAQGTNFCSHCGTPYRQAVGGSTRTQPNDDDLSGGGMWVEALLSIGVGIFLLLIAPRGISYWKTQLFGGTFTPFPSGQTIQMQNLQTGAVTSYTYHQLLSGFWSDTAVTAFALILIVEGIILGLVRNRWVILISALLALAVTMLNLWLVISGYRTVDPTAPFPGQTYGLFPMSAIAILFGLFIAGFQLRLFAVLKRK